VRRTLGQQSHSKQFEQQVQIFPAETSLQLVLRLIQQLSKLLGTIKGFVDVQYISSLCFLV